VVKDPRDLVSGGGDRLSRTELSPHAPKELAEVTFRTAQRVSAHAERSRSAMLYLAGLQDSTLPPLIRCSGQRPSQEAKAGALRNHRSALWLLFSLRHDLLLVAGEHGPRGES